jgi:hypothetical protein
MTVKRRDNPKRRVLRRSETPKSGVSLATSRRQSESLAKRHSSLTTDRSKSQSLREAADYEK